MFSLEELDQALPPQLKGRMTPEIAQNLNTIITDPQVAQSFRDNFVSYTNVLKEGRFKLESYMDAVAYVSFKLMGYTDRECYQRTFPNRYAELVARGTSAKDIAAYVAAYNRNILVNKVLEQTLIPTYVLNQDIYQKAINVQADLMTNGKSEMVRMKAADSILNHLKRPEATKVELSVGLQESSEVDELKQIMRDLAANQRNMIAGGTPTKEIAHQRIIDVTPNQADS